ncbi:hypothetical protein HBH56_046770 [Parastagonospora nodorum]|uniref:Pentatricopeptide repeat protein n=1 Tax=Phaeosphaeria nodorum (strain SN15 / ATCC MYA-4574 / FGSC 10173) TaxID=321614 RepID=A0A7U2ET62_PHANO|nr:hypothetical protein HBH56_046770 [Parastagonospora nodorum]QRC92588.1 hypothetical protein JI435_305870 [Parastagonospora nodorum SN15]KAH3933119.1 hypothetical protein HBH54_074520 [Parastagonospora nodorum]KAH4139837.1 hypothetical protein HBH45_089190 [Parastagonospora nodorum]KAH4169015.1 hypothetical protein HBH44_047440 [Parastagonospora nodorum]
MLNCRACLWRCIEAVDAPAGNVQRLRRHVNPFLRPGQRRLQSTREDVVRKKEWKPRYQSETDRLSSKKKDPWSTSAVAANQKKRERAALRQEPQKVYDTPNLAKLGSRDPDVSDRDWNNRKRELRHLQDPLELAVFVKSELRKGKAAEMLQLVRMASHSMACIVSWNHIIDHYLANERIADAMKVYNDMKKRQQFPDSYTYTILLRGLSINAHHSGVIAKALSVYHSLYAPNSRVEPSIIHTNAALRVCARAMDMDALWGIAAKIPEKGPQAANPVTYLTIINAVRQNLLLNPPKDETADEIAVRRERGILEARRMWEGIVTRWRNAELKIDEELVCAMARLLLIGSRPRDWDDVLSLVEQTMDIPRLVPQLGTAEHKKAGLAGIRAPSTPAHLRDDQELLAPGESPSRGDEFLALTPHAVARAVSSPLTYARPGNNTLSVIQEACQKLVSNKAAQEYWDLLTDPTTYDIAPDLNNLHTRLRNLRQNRASAAVVAVLRDDMLAKDVIPKPGTFRIAMSTCIRDKNNHNSLRNAGEILQIMLKTLADVDSKAAGLYAELAVTHPLAKGEDLVDALTLLNPILRNLRLQLGVGGARPGNRVGATYLRGEERQDAIGALRKIYAVYDRLLESNMLEESKQKPFKEARARLSSFIQRLMFKELGGKPRPRVSKANEEDVEASVDDVDPHAYLKYEEEALDQRDEKDSSRKQRAKPAARGYWLDARGRD